MKIRLWHATGLLALMVVSVRELCAGPTPIEGPGQHAPPPFPPVEVRPATPAEERWRPRDVGTTQYSIGQPTEEEQQYLELMNRARADPAAEGERLRGTTDPEVVSAYAFFGVDLDMMVAEFAAIDAAPPLAMNARLLDAARLHSADMFANEFQGHTGSDGSSLGQRVTAQGYPWSTVAENVYSFARSVWHGHAGFNVDWGDDGPGGMQLGRGHRVAIHNANYREVGVGVVLGRNGTVGPQLVTQNFGTQQGATPLLTGVAYYDLNGNDFFDPGEGIGGVTVLVDGSAFHAVTADTGGYAVPVPGDGNYTVTFSGPGLPDHQQLIEVTGLRNEKIDFRPSYDPPEVVGPDPALPESDNVYTFTAVGGAVGHQVEQTRLGSYTRIEGAEEGLDQVTVVSSLGYEVVSTSIRASGARSFRLAHPSPPMAQILTLNAVLKPSASSQLTFQSRLGWASANQVARVDVTTDGGHGWEELWSRTGTGNQGQTSFQPVALALGAYAGDPLRVRFVYDYLSGTFFPQTEDGVGWYIDDIAVSDAEELLDPVVVDVVLVNSFVFRPATRDDHILRVRAQLPGDRFLPWGPVARVAVSDAVPAVIRFVGMPVIGAGRLTLRFTLEAGAAAGFAIHETDVIGGVWQAVSGVTLHELGGGAFEVELPLPGGPSRFYRVLAID
jgi:hypothetical protein